MTMCEDVVDCEDVADRRDDAARTGLDVDRTEIACAWLTFQRHRGWSPIA